MWAVGVAVVVVVLVCLALVSAPYVFAELSAWLEPHAIIDPAEPDLGEGRMVDDYWAVHTSTRTRTRSVSHVTTRLITRISFSVDDGRCCSMPARAHATSPASSRA